MDNTEKKMFRKSFLGGFSKEDVNNYISEVSDRYNAEKNELSERLSEAEKKNAELSAALAAANAKIDVLSKDSAELSELRGKHETLNKSFEEASAEIKSLTTENSILKAKEAALTQVEREYSSRKAELAEIEISAKLRANEIVSEAEETAAKLRSELERTLSEKKREFEDRKKAVIAEAANETGAVTKLLSALKTEIESMDIRILRMADNLRTNVLSLSDAVSNASDKTDGIMERLAKSCEIKED